jgi:hypothetical protein
MLFRHPAEQIDFEIPDEWIHQTGWLGRPGSCSRYYSSNSTDAKIIDIREIAAPKRAAGIRWFDRQRTISILSAMKNDAILPPINCYADAYSPKLSVQDGFHRYYLSIAFGFTAIPVVHVDFFDMNSPTA